MLKNRCRIIKQEKKIKGPVVYWMSREQRVNDNWGLLTAQEIALKNNNPLIVIFCLTLSYPGANIRHYSFMIEGLKDVNKDLKALNIPFVFLKGDPIEKIPEYINKIDASLLITDFDPIKTKVKWKNSILQKTDLPIYEVDSHNVIPCWITSNKQEYAARTIRPKIHKHLIDYLTEFPQIKKHPINLNIEIPSINWNDLVKDLKIDTNIKTVDWLKPGENYAKITLEQFITQKLNNYSSQKNNPTKEYISNLSPYLHFGQISAQRIALEINKSKSNQSEKESYLEELIVRKELSDNFCFHNQNYDNLNSIHNWAKTTLLEHKNDIRTYTYTLEELEKSLTHDDLWNASQKEMSIKGKMHGYMRMYWAKKILEWTSSPEEALEYCIYLNDKYELDGRDPNGYVGILWSIGGLHDRAWKERQIFGKIRYMSYNGCKSKFDISTYIKKINSLSDSILKK